MAATTLKHEVRSVSWETVTVMTPGGPDRYLSWDQLRKAATQDDADLRAAYGLLLATARQMAGGRKMVKVVARNLNGSQQDTGARTWAAMLTDPAGEHITGRTVAADWGQTGTRAYALRDRDEAVRVLRDRGYDVRS